MHWQKIYLQPIEETDHLVMESLTEQIEKKFGYPTRRLSSVPMPQYGYDPARGQHCSTVLLKSLALHVPDDAIRMLALTEVDLFVPQFSFVFGQAAIDGPICIVSFNRLRPQHYGSAPDDDLFRTRAAKESFHELGHSFGLHHCHDETCIMYFSHNIQDTDRKSRDFCGSCSARLEAGMAEGAAAS